MPIPDNALIRTLIPRLLSPSITVAELLYLFAEQPTPQQMYAVVRFDADAYDVLALNDLETHTTLHGAALLPRALNTIAGLLKAGAPVTQTQVGLARAERDMTARHRGRLVVLDDSGAVVGLLVDNLRDGFIGASPLDLLDDAGAVVLGPTTGAPTAPPHVNTRFDGVGPTEPLIVGRRVPLIVSVGAPTATNAAQNSQVFAFDFAGQAAPVPFTVHVDGNPNKWTIKAVEPTLIVAPPGETIQEAEFSIVAKTAGASDLHISIERAGATLQHIWLSVAAVIDQAAARRHTPMLQQRVDSGYAPDTSDVSRADVELVVQEDGAIFAVTVRASLPNGMVRATYPLAVTGQEIQNATERLRQELRKLLLYPNLAGQSGLPFANNDTLTVDATLARRACVSLADAGRQVWEMRSRRSKPMRPSVGGGLVVPTLRRSNAPWR